MRGTAARSVVTPAGRRDVLMPPAAELPKQTEATAVRAGTCEFGPGGPVVHSVRRVDRGGKSPAACVPPERCVHRSAPVGFPTVRGRTRLLPVHHLTLPTTLLAALLAAAPNPAATGAPQASPLAGLGAGRTSADLDSGPWRPPIRPVTVLRGFDPPDRPWLAGHRGVDLRASPGQAVRAAGAGRVTFAADLAGRGVVVVDHGALRTTYEPVDAEVSVGRRVAAGERLGTVATGSGHCGSGRCLHLGLRRGGTYLDPLLALGASHARLVPW
jgi:hypothetical protein